MNSLPFQPHTHTHTHTYCLKRKCSMNLLWKEPLCLRKHVLLPEAVSCLLTRHPDHPALLIASRAFPLTSAAHASLLLSGSVSRGICLQFYFPGYLERQLPKSISLPSRGIGNKFRGKIELQVYCTGRYARETKAECGRDILVGKDSDDERTIVGLEPAGLGHWMGGNKVEGTKVAEFGISA